MFNYEPSYQKKIKLYADGANYESMVELSKNPDIQGLTTNPSLMKSAGVKEYTPFCKKILREITNKPISFEVFADDFSSMNTQAQEIKTWGDNVYVKIPVTNSKGESSIPLIKELAASGVKLNVTAIFTLDQVMDVAMALKDGAPSIVSVFAGRIADTGVDPTPIMLSAAGICSTVDKNMELLWASTREAYNIVQAEQANCDIITVPPKILGGMKKFGKSLEQYSLETVLAFKNDAEEVGYTI